MDFGIFGVATEIGKFFSDDIGNLLMVVEAPACLPIPVTGGRVWVLTRLWPLPVWPLHDLGGPGNTCLLLLFPAALSYNPPSCPVCGIVDCSICWWALPVILGIPCARLVTSQLMDRLLPPIYPIWPIRLYYLWRKPQVEAGQSGLGRWAGCDIWRKGGDGQAVMTVEICAPGNPVIVHWRPHGQGEPTISYICAGACPQWPDRMPISLTLPFPHVFTLQL